MWGFWSHRDKLPLPGLGFGPKERTVPDSAHALPVFTKSQRGSWPCLQRGPKGRLVKSPGILTISMPVVYSFLFKFRNRVFSHLTCSWLQKGLQLFTYVAEVPKDTQHGWQLPGGLAPLTLQLSRVFWKLLYSSKSFFLGTLWSENFHVSMLPGPILFFQMSWLEKGCRMASLPWEPVSSSFIYYPCMSWLSWNTSFLTNHTKCEMHCSLVNGVVMMSFLGILHV